MHSRDQLRLAAQPEHSILVNGVARGIIHELRAHRAQVERAFRVRYAKEQCGGRFASNCICLWKGV